MKKLKHVYADRIIKRGKNYIGNVNYCIKIGNFLYGEVEGTSTYKTKINLKTLDGDCSCPYSTNCKHAVAVYLVYKNGDYINADGFIEHLGSLSKEELIKIIVDNLHNNPDIALNYDLRKLTDFGSFVNDFINNFSYSKMNKAQRILSCFSFNQLLRMLIFLEKNEEDVLDEAYEEHDVAGEDALYNFESELEEEIIKKITTKKELRRAIKMYSLRQEIISNAEQFVKFKEIIKSYLSKDNYLMFLLRQNNPDLNEIRKNITAENKIMVLHLPGYNINLAEKLANFLNNKTLLFLVAVYKEDYKNIIKHFNEFDKAMKEASSVLEKKLGFIIELFMKNNLKDENIAKKFLKKKFLNSYHKKFIKYLVNQIKDYDYIKDLLDFEEGIYQNLPLLGRLVNLNKTKTKKLIGNTENILYSKHWASVVDFLKFLKKKYGNRYVKDFIKRNEDIFKTSSTLKLNLKKQNIFISYIKGKLVVDVK